jgi:hypothetical protein
VDVRGDLPVIALVETLERAIVASPQRVDELGVGDVRCARPGRCEFSLRGDVAVPPRTIRSLGWFRRVREL